MRRVTCRCPKCAGPVFDHSYTLGKEQVCWACFVEGKAGDLLKAFPVLFPDPEPVEMTTEQLARSLGIIEGDERLLDEIPQ